MKVNNFLINNSIEKLLNDEETTFLNPFELKQLSYCLKKKNYNIYEVYQGCDKVVLYTKKEPNIILYQIISSNPLRHQDILGSLFNEGFNNNSFGDIVIKDNNYYFYALPKIEKQLDNYFNKVGKYNINLKKVPLDTLKDYQRSYEEINILVSSLRLDVILKELLKTNRNKVVDLIQNKKVTINYEILTKVSYFLKENDTFSIHRFGKYKFVEIIKSTSKNKLLIRIIKYT